MDIVTGLLLGINKENVKIPDELMEFLSQDDQGVDGLEFMLKNPKLFKRIPDNARLQYEILQGNLSASVEKELLKTRDAINEIIANPKPVIHQMLQQMYEEQKED